MISGGCIMSIRMIAKELYLLQQEVDNLEKQIQESPIDRRLKLEEMLRKAKAERNRLRNILEGQKSNAATQKRRF